MSHTSTRSNGADSFGVRPQRARSWSAPCPPPAKNRRCQLYRVCRVTPRRAATSTADAPRSKSRSARMRFTRAPSRALLSAA
jgi:hypothetical protein